MTRIGSLFSGYGGLDMAVKSVWPEAETAWVSDVCKVDKKGNVGHHEPHRAPCSILAHHWPDVPNHGDITAIDWSAVEPVEVLTAGYPCQPFSHAGKRAGTDDTRHLWPYVVEAMSVLRPRLAVFENVQGHLTLGFDEVLRDLHALGYAAAWVLISAASVGAPHRRNRLFILAEDTRGQLRSRTNRRGGLHRHSGVGRVIPGPAQDLHVRQGVACASPDGTGLWREGGTGPASDRCPSRVVDVATDGASSCRGDRDIASTPASEGGTGSHRPRVSGDGGRFATLAERAGDMDIRNAAEGLGVSGAHPGSESTRPGPDAAQTAEREACGGVSLGRLVGAGGRPVRASGIRGQDADARIDGGGARLLDPSAGVDVPLLPTPRTSDTNGAGVHGQGGMDLRTAVTLLPTPAVNDMGEGKTIEAWDEWTAKMQASHANGNGHGKSLAIEAQRLLPTPMVGSCSPASHGQVSGQWREQMAEALTRWGDYADAIARWEALTRPAPAPTQTSKKGTPQLSPAFSEWLMGLPAGHVTDVPGLSRNDQLKALGNGVVPAQAAEAIRRLLPIIQIKDAA